jgi:hypothetical protein
MSPPYRRFFVTVVAAAALFRCSPANAQESPDVAVTGEPPSAAAPQSSTATPDGNWHFAITPYLWFAGAHGTAGFGGRDVSYHASFGDIISKFNIGIMVAGEARKERFLIPFDFWWIKVSDDKGLPESPFPGATSIKAKLYQSILTPKAGYRVVDNEKLKVDGTLGIRYWHLGENISLQPSNINNSQSANWVDVVAGARFQMPLSPKAVVMIGGDAGGGGANVDYQVAGILGYKVKPNILLQLGWRYLDVNYRPSSTFIFDGVTTGILLGATFNLK